MRKTASIHHLTDIDQECRTAVCSVCGPTQVYIAKGRTPQSAARVYCMTRIRKSSWIQSQRLHEQRHLQNPDKKPRHSLSKINAKKMTAICSVCDRTDIRKRLVGKKGTFYICANKKREYAREYRLAHYIPRPRKPRQSGHSLSKINDKKKTAVCLQCGPVRIYVSHIKGKTIRRCSKANQQYVLQARENNKQFIDEYKVQRGCQRCGYNASPIGLDLHNHNLREKDLYITRVIGYSRKRLLLELKKCDVLCAICHRLVHHELDDS